MVFYSIHLEGLRKASAKIIMDTAFRVADWSYQGPRSYQNILIKKGKFDLLLYITLGPRVNADDVISSIADLAKSEY